MTDYLRSTAARARVGAGVAVSMVSMVVAAVLTGTAAEAVTRRLGGRDRGAVTLEQAIITGALAAGALLVTGLIIAAVRSHTDSIR